MSKNMGQNGLAGDAQLGKDGPRLVVSGQVVEHRTSAGALTPASGAPASTDDQFVTRAQILRQLAHVFGTASNPTKSNSTWATIPQLTALVTPTGSSIQVSFECNLYLNPPASGATVEGNVRLAVGGVAVANSTRNVRYQSAAILALTPGDVRIPFSSSVYNLTGLAPGTPITVAAQWQATTNTLVAYSTERSLRVVEGMRT